MFQHRRITSATTNLMHNCVLRGAVSGVAGTLLMSVPIVVSQRLGLISTTPPEQISDNVGKRTPLLPERSNPAFPVAAIGAHLAYGAACGTAFSVFRRTLPSSTDGAGLLFGLGVWTVSYAGYVPALRLYPWPDDDSRSRQLVMILAHAIFGVVVSEANDNFANHR